MCSRVRTNFKTRMAIYARILQIIRKRFGNLKEAIDIRMLLINGIFSQTSDVRYLANSYFRTY